jgi:hypothetical protein
MSRFTRQVLVSMTPEMHEAIKLTASINQTTVNAEIRKALGVYTHAQPSKPTDLDIDWDEPTSEV